MTYQCLCPQYDEFVRSKSPASKAVLALEALWYIAPGWAAALFGGAARDILLEGKSACPRDLDVVTIGPSLQQLREALPFPTTRNTFGGLKLEIHGVSVDIWPLENTQAFKKHPLGRPATFADLMPTTMFNFEAVVMELSHEAKVHDGGFNECMRTRTLELQNPEVVSPALCIIRACVFAMRFQLTWGPKLQAYSLQELPKLDAKTLDRVQRNYYGQIKVPGQYILQLADCRLERVGVGICNPRGMLST